MPDILIIQSPGPSGVASEISNLADVNLDGLVDVQVLAWDADSGTWTPLTIPLTVNGRAGVVVGLAEQSALDALITRVTALEAALGQFYGGTPYPSSSVFPSTSLYPAA